MTLRHPTYSAPTIILLCGPPCSGKSTLGDALQRHWKLGDYPRFEMDDIRQALFTHGAGPEERRKAYAHMHELAANAIRGGAPGAILVATYQPLEQRRAIAVLANDLRARVQLFECLIDPYVAAARFQRRSRTHPATDLSAEKVWDLAGDFPYSPQATRLNTSIDDAFQEQVEIIVRQIESGTTVSQLDKWVDQARQSAPPRKSGGSDDDLPKLTAKSRSKARWDQNQRRLFFAAFGIALVVTILTTAFPLASGLQRHFPGRVASVAAAIDPVIAIAIRMWRALGVVPMRMWDGLCTIGSGRSLLCPDILGHNAESAIRTAVLAALVLGSAFAAAWRPRQASWDTTGPRGRLVALLVCAAALCGLFVPWVAAHARSAPWRLGALADPSTWATLAALFGGGYLATREQIFGSKEARVSRNILTAGTVPKLFFQEGSPSNDVVYRRYMRRLTCAARRRMLIADVPLWFLVEPRAEGFDIGFELKMIISPVDAKCLRERAADRGLDWQGFIEWRTHQKQDQYYDKYREEGVRALDLKEPDGAVTVTVCKGDYHSYVSTELSANLETDGRFGYSIREILEGPEWLRSRPPGAAASADSTCDRHEVAVDDAEGGEALGGNEVEQAGEALACGRVTPCWWDPTRPFTRPGTLNLSDVRKAGQTHEMLLGVQVALTTSDGYLVLQRRSNQVQTAAGGVASSAAGACQWSDLACGRRSFVASALREAEEELGWVPHRNDDLSAPFLGAAFNLLRGRDLNFYCHFHTERRFEEISRASRSHHGIGRRLHPRRARDAWEFTELIPVPVGAIRDDGTVADPHMALIGDGRHVRGLIYCLSKSRKFLDIRDRFLKPGGGRSFCPAAHPAG